MRNERVRSAYAERAAEYAEALGTMDAVHDEDRRLVAGWAKTVDGPILDAGCGPGHWTRFLADCGADAAGLDQVPAFIKQARHRFPGVPFREGRLEELDVEEGALGGVLAWYSLIHHRPEAVHVPLRQFARALKPAGTLLVGFFDGPAVEPFDHAVVTAFRWSAEELGAELDRAGFDVLETRRRTEAGHRPHGAILSRRRSLQQATRPGSEKAVSGAVTHIPAFRTGSGYEPNTR